MNEEAFKESYRLFSSQGYNGTIDEYKNLISTNSEAKKESYRLFSSEGYNGDENEFNSLIGIGLGKTGAVVEGDATTSADMGSASVDGSLEPQEELRDTGLEGIYKKATKDTPTDYNVENPIAQFFIDKTAAFVSGAGSLLAGAADLVEAVPDALISSGINAYNWFGDDDTDITQETKNEVSNFIEDIFFVDDALRIVSSEASKFKTVRDSDDGEGILGAFEKGNYLEAIDRTISGAFEAAPSVIAAIVPGGIYVVGASAVGSHYEEKSEFSDKDRGLGMLTTSLAQGGVEMASEMVTRGIFKGAAKTFKIAGKSTKESIKETAKLMGKDMFYEGASEVGSEEVNNAIDQMYGLNKFYDKNGDFDGTALLQRSFDTFIISSVLGGAASAGGTVSKKKKEKKKLNKIQQAFKEDRMMSPEMRGENLKIQDSIKKLEKENEGVNNEQVNDKISSLKAKLDSNVSSNKAIVGSMKDEDFKEYFDLLDKNIDLKAEANNLDLTDSQKEINLSLLEQNNNRLNEIYNNTVATNNEAVIEEVESIEEGVSEKTENVFSQDDANVYTSPTDEKYATINRGDGKGNVNLTKEEFDALDKAPAEQKKPQTVQELELERNAKLDEINLAIKESEAKGETPMVDGKPVTREDLDLVNKDYRSKIEEASKTQEEVVEEVIEEVKAEDEVPAEVVKLRAEEQAEMLEQVPGAENALTDGKVDDEKLTTEEGKTKFKEIYDNYNDKISPFLGKKEVEDLNTGTTTISKAIKIFKGLGGKKDLKGQRLSAHDGVSGVFSAIDEDMANDYARGEGISEILVPSGTTVEVIEIPRSKGMPMSEYRAKEVEAINNSDAQIVKLITLDSKIKKGSKSNKQSQYIIKDSGLIADIYDSKGETKTKAKKKGKTKTQKAVDKQVDKKIPSSEKVTITAKSALYQTLKNLNRGGKYAANEIKAFRKDLQSKLKGITEGKKGEITTKQASAIIKKINTVNPNNSNQVDDLQSYVEKVFNDADYSDKISKADNVRKQVKKGAKDKNQEATLVELAKRFAKINPKNVKDIDAYIEMANKIKDGVVTSKVIKTDVNWTSSPDIVSADAYISDQMQLQNEIELKRKSEEFERVTGIPSGDLTYDQMIDILYSEKEVDSTKNTLIRKGIDKTFETYKSIINSIISQGVDPFTGENLTLKNKDLIKEFMNLDLNGLEIKEAIRAVDSLNNFLINGSTGGMQSVVSNQKGVKGALSLAKASIKSRDLKLFFSNFIGRSLGKELTSLNILFETMFPGQSKAAKVMNAIGVTDLISGVSSARRDTTTITKKYLKKFEKTKPNNKSFNDEYNITERGIIGFMTRNVIGDKATQQSKFDDNKSLIQQTINNLEKGSKDQIKKAETYKEVYDSILKDSKSIDQVHSKSNKTNLEAVEFWQKEWKALYPQLADVSLNVYNKVLSEDVNYVPRSIKNVDISEKSEFDWDESAFVGNEGTVYQRKSGTLQDVVLERNISEKGKEKYVDLNFDSNNSFLYQSALTDVNTASPIRQVKGAIESDSWSKLIPNKADRKMLENRLKGYIANARGKDASMNDFSKEVNKYVNFFSGLGTTIALASGFQPIKQTVPVAINTLINTGGMLDIKEVLTSSANEFIDKSGYAVSNRGKESQTTLDADKVLDSIDTSTLGKSIFSGIKKGNSKLLELALVKPDVFIARASWLSYYKKSLKNQGVDISNIDWDTQKLNKEAGNYAQQQVDRQQNVSDADLQGDFLTGKDPVTQVAKKVIIPFMNFVLNQKARMYSDIIALSSNTASSQDKKEAARSLAGLLAELTTFTFISSGIRDLVWSATKLALDFEEDEEDIKDRKEFEKSLIVTNFVTDIFSPIPLTDYPILSFTDKLLELGQEEIINTDMYGEQFKTFNKDKKGYIESLGLFGIAIANWNETKKIYEMAVDGTITKEAYGKEEKTFIPKETQDAMSLLLFMSIFSNLGLLPTDVKNVSKKAIRIAEMQTRYPEYQEKISIREMLEGSQEEESIEAIQEVEEKGLPPLPEE